MTNIVISTSGNAKTVVVNRGIAGISGGGVVAKEYWTPQENMVVGVIESIYQNASNDATIVSPLDIYGLQEG